MFRRTATRIFACVLGAVFLTAQAVCPGVLASDFIVNSGTTTTVQSTPGTPYTQSVTGNITIDGTLRGVEAATPGGALTGNGGDIILTTSGGVFFLGSNGVINVMASAPGGKGGTLTINAPVITADGKIYADGWGSGAGGRITMNGGTVNIGTAGLLSAKSGGTTGQGGVVDINGTGAVAMASGGIIRTNGLTTIGSTNLVTIDGAGVNLGGTITTAGSGTGNVNGGKVAVNSTGALTVSGAMDANSALGGNGGQIQLSGTTVDVSSTVSAVSANSGGQGGVIDIDATTGAATIANTGIVQTKGLTTTGTTNLITVDGVGVTVNGQVLADGYGTATKGGKVVLTGNGTSTVQVNATGKVQANGRSATAGGGDITLLGNVTNNGGLIEASAKVSGNNRSGGTIIIGNGTTTKQFTNQNNGTVVADTAVGDTTANGGTITVDTGTITVAKGLVQANGPVSSGTGNAGTISMTARSGNIVVNGTAGASDAKITAKGMRGGGVTLNSTSGSVTVGSGGWVTASGSNDTVLNVTGTGISVAGILENGGNQGGHGGAMTLNAGAGDLIVTGDNGVGQLGRLSVAGGVTPAAAGSGTNAGTLTATARDIIFQNDASVSAYGQQRTDLNSGLGNGGVLTFNASRDFTTATDTNLNARGTTVPSGNTFTKGVINVSAGRNASLDGFIHVGGRRGANSGGGLLSITAAQNLTVASSANLSANGNATTSLGTFTGNGGRVDLTSTSGNIQINGGLVVMPDGSERGLIDVSGGMAGGAGGQVNIAANNGTITTNGVLIRARGRNVADLGGKVSFLASSAVSLDSTTSIQTRGRSNGTTNNFIAFNGSAVDLNGATVDAAVHAGGTTGGYVQIIASGVNTLNDADLAGVNVNTNTTATGGRVDLYGSSIVSNGNNLNFGSNSTLFMATNANSAGGITATNSTYGGRDVMFLNNVGTGGGIDLTGSTINASNTSLFWNAGNVGGITMGSGTFGATSTGTSFLSGAGNISVTANFTNVPSVAATASAGNISLTSTAGGIKLGTNNANGSLTVTANAGNITGAVGSPALTATTGNIGLTAAAGSINLNTSGNVWAGGNVNMNAQTISAVAGSYVGTVQATSTVGSSTITSSNGTIALGDVSSASAVVVTANAGGMTLGSGKSITANGGQTALLKATGDITNNGATVTGTAIHLASNGNVTSTTGDLVSGNIQIYGFAGTGARANNVNISRNGSLAISRVRASGNTTLVANAVNSDLTVSNADVLGTTLLQADRNITATAANLFQGPVNAYGISGTSDYLNSFSLTQAGDITLGRLTTTNATVTASSTGKNISISNLETNDGTIDVTTAGTGTIAVSNSVINSLDDLRLTTGSGAITLNNNSMQLLRVRGSGSGGTSGVFTYSTGALNMAGNTLTGALDVNSATTAVTATSGTFGGAISVTNASNVDIIASGDLDIDAITTSGNASFVSTGTIDNTNGVINATSGTVQLVTTGANKNVLVEANINARNVTLAANGTNGDVFLNSRLLANDGTNGGTVVIAANRNITFMSGSADIRADAAANGGNGGKITLTAGGLVDINAGGNLLATAGQVQSGQGANQNNVAITGQAINFGGQINADGQSGFGGQGGTVAFTTSTGDINILSTADIFANGYVASNSYRGNGGSINLTAGGNYIQNGGHLDASSTRQSAVQGLTNYGGTVVLTGRTVNITDGSGTQVNVSGASYGAGSNLYGGAGGGIAVVATDNTLNATRITLSGTGTIFDVSGGNGRNYAGGNGGLLHFAPGFNGGQMSLPGGFTYVTGLGGTSNGGATGNAGQIWLNGAYSSTIGN